MTRRNNRLFVFLREAEGATAVEYSSMIVLIILVCIATIAILGGNVEQAFNTFVTKYNELTGS